MLFSATPALADEWRLTPSVTGRAELTDNVGQAPDSSKQSALILGVTPGFHLELLGASRLKVDVSYFLTGVERFEEKSGNRSDLNHNLGASANAELIDQLFFVDARANVSQVLTSLLGAPGGGTLDTGNLTTVGTYSVSPYLTKRFGSFASGLARYTNSGALFQNNGSNINSNTLTAALNSGPRFNDLSWALNYSLRDVKLQDDGSNQFEHYDATLGYAVTRKIRVFGSVGYDNNDYPSLGKTSGPSWSAGLGWAPSRLTSMDASAGHNYFGNTYAAHFNHRTHFSTWSAQYSEGVNDVSQFLASQTIDRAFWQCGTFVLPDGNILVSIQPTDSFTVAPKGCSNPLTSSQLIASNLFTTQQLLQLGAINLSLAKGVFLNKTLVGGVAWGKGKNGLGLNVFDTKRIYQNLIGLPGDESRGISGLYSYRLDPNTTLNTTLSLTNNIVPALVSGSTIDRNDKIYMASVGVTRKFQPKLTGSLVYRYTTRHSNDSAADFVENNLTALVNLTF